MKRIVIANWKMNPQSLEKAKTLFNLIKNEVGERKNTEVVICPPFIFLPDLTKIAGFVQNLDTIKFGAQNCFWSQSGPFTGEISPQMLENIGCQYVIIGHSERRQYLTETSEVIAKKLKAVFKTKLIPILCIGETQQQRNQGKTEKILSQELKVLSQISKPRSEIRNLIIAYEPIWAIGSGNACNSDEALKTKLLIEKILNSLKIQSSIILYGGSVNSNNAKNYIEAGFNGLLVGNASLDAKEFVKIVKSIDKI